jgi:hypothetical protein
MLKQHRTYISVAVALFILFGTVFVFKKQSEFPSFLLRRSEKDINTIYNPGDFIGILYDENGKAIIQSCFREDLFKEFVILSTDNWIPAEYYTEDYTIRFLLPPDYSLKIEGDNKIILADNPIYQRMRGSIHTRAEDFLRNITFYSEYSNDYGINYSPSNGWSKQYIYSERYTGYATCEANPYVDANNLKIFMTAGGDAGAYGETFFREIDKKIIEFSMVYVLGGDAGDGLNLPDNPKKITTEIRNSVLTILSTVKVTPN